MSKIFKSNDLADVANSVLGDPETAFKDANKAFQTGMRKFNDKIKVKHPWGKNRTFNLRSKHKYKDLGHLKAQINSEADYSAAIYKKRKAYPINPRRRKFLSGIHNGKRWFSKGPILIPERKANPWIEDAWKKDAPNILGKMSSAVIEKL